jgi:hypothetical protein
MLIQEVVMPSVPEDEAAYEAQIQRILKQVEAKLRKDLKHGIRPLHKIEAEVEEIGEFIKETITKEVVDELGAGYVGSRVRCSCGALGMYKGCRERRMITLHGVVPYSRAYYYCRGCRCGFCPIDAQMEVGSGDCSRSVQALMARFCSYLPFETASQELEAVCGIRLSATTVQRYAKQIGHRIGAEWDALTGQVLSRRAPSTGLRPKRLYQSMDGVKVHIGGGWRDVKLGMTYQRSSSARITHAMYYGSIEHSRDFGPKMLALSHRSGGDRCNDMEMVADGAEWIWQETGKYFPLSVQVLDFYHLCEHLWGAANARFGPETEEGRQWMQLQKGRLLEDQAALVVTDVERWQPRKKANTEIKRKLIAYMRTHRQRMNYKTLREQGYHIGSGLMEAACKTVVKARMTAAGMRWEEPGAKAILNLTTLWKTKHNTGFEKYTA